ncbi:MAG: 8-oxo-dGTP diphosphatase [Candidatus Harrisonbacteria bacterium]|nr:8-oxo-dGTP diphosphatase [Candidatus Harrisonbacteria bacterium]
MGSKNMKKQLTLTIIHQHPKILLGMKKRGFGAGRWNGFGGKVNPEESIEDGARRELHEEAGVEVSQLEKIGIINFSFQDKEEVLEVHIFRSEDFSGEPRESEEMKPEWFHVDEIPFAQMWPDDIHWIPLFLERKKFKGRFLFGEADAILEQELKEVEEV